MGKIPQNLLNDELSQYLSEKGLKLISQGKVRNTFFVNPDCLLVVATDRISAFDFVFNALIPKKGEVLTAMSHFWFNKVLPNFDNHLIRARSKPKFNAAYDLKGAALSQLPTERSLVVENMGEKLYPFEMIYRHHIGGSVFKDYQKTGMAGGHQLTPGLPKWSKLAKPIFTPSTKEEVDHDVNVNADYFFAEMKKKGLEVESLRAADMLATAYNEAYSYAQERGILILDTKFEIAGLKIVDEILTPDSSRFAVAEDWEKAMAEGRDPHFFDKQLVRDWAAKVETPFDVVGVNKLSPKNPDHVAYVHGLRIPEEIVQETTKRYLQIFERLTGLSLREYQKKEMGVWF